MPTKLKGLAVSKVDFVDAGANQKADIVFFKRSSESEPVVNVEPKQPGVFKRAFVALAAALGIAEEETEEIAKDAASFDEKLAERQRRRVADEMWEFCYLFQESLCSIFWDNEIPDADKAVKMAESLDEFTETLKAALPRWAVGEPTKVAKAADTDALAEHMRKAHEHLGEMLSMAKGMPEDSGVKTEETKGDCTDMKIDKSKLTPEERAALEALEKKAGIPEETPAPPPAEPAPPVAKAAEQPAPESDDIYKGLHPEVKAELERLRKSADAAEERELTELAKKYEIIGKKPEELVPLLKSLKAAGGDAYGQMVAVLDASVAAVEKSGLFSELGKRGGSAEPDAWTTVEKHADEIQKANPALSRFEAVDTAARQHPELVQEYEKNR